MAHTLKETSLKILLFSALAILLLYYYNLLWIYAAPTWLSDYIYFYISGEQALKQQDFYSPLLFFKESKLPVINLNLPLMGILMIPFRFLAYSTSFFAWGTLSLIMGILSIFLILKNLFQPKSSSKSSSKSS